MFKSIPAKLLAVFISILLIGSLITGIILYYFISDYLLEEKQEQVEQNGNIVRLIAEENIESFSSLAFQVYFRSVLRFYSENNQQLIWIVDTDGRILITENIRADLAIPKEILSGLKMEAGYYVLPDSKQYSKVMSGSEEIIKEQGYFYGLFNRTGMPWLTVQIPITYEGNTIAAVFVNTPIPEIQKVQNNVLKMFLISTLVSIAVSSALALIYSRKLSKPLKEMSKAAKEISQGNFSKRMDISSNDEIGDLAASFNIMSRDLENLESLRSSFIANVSHELRTPMTSIQGFIEGILDGTAPKEKVKDYLVIVRDETARLSRLINDLMQLSQMEAGKISVKYTEFDINEVLRLSVISLENLIESRGISVEASFANEKTFVRSDIDMVRRIVLNLLHNALKFTPEKGRITISTELKKSKVHVMIADNGPGISEEDIDRIWDRFYKSDKSRGRDRSGSGLGLAIVKGLINNLGESIWVKSIPDVGTEFTFTLSLSFTMEN